MSNSTKFQRPFVKKANIISLFEGFVAAAAGIPPEILYKVEGIVLNSFDGVVAGIEDNSRHDDGVPFYTGIPRTGLPFGP